MDGAGGCSHRAQVTALSTHPSQVTSVVFAEEEGMYKPLQEKYETKTPKHLSTLQ